jgi:3-oxoadipate enol-lactonase
MATLEIGPGEALHYNHQAPTDDGKTFVFVNALTSDMSLWDAEIAPSLRAAGHGTLVYNLRGQVDSPASPDRRFGCRLNRRRPGSSSRPRRAGA